ncbi:hypothetical protein NDU88_001965 [Pleurodeles waltl]|uniref:Reverse transcriptase n=1 Tax=Pleurodeles waltl TaxID=8319 RepID=A0AAV7SDM0_PLEWA|nr:hypothetical protein NDU88_001965 [Pleurodeles waltl]
MADQKWVALRKAAVSRNSSKFWAIISEGCGNRKSPMTPLIAEEDWREYILALYVEIGEMKIGEADSSLSKDIDLVNCGLQEIEGLIESMRASGTMGPGEVLMAVIKREPQLWARILCPVFRACYLQGSIPDSWTGSVIVPTFKKGR